MPDDTATTLEGEPMPRFDTPEPVSATIDIPLGVVHLIASDRTDTAITVNPSDLHRPRDVQVAEGTVIDHTEGRVTVTSPRPRGLANMVSGADRYGSVEVVVELPTGSSLDVTAQVGDVRADGRLAEVAVRTAVGNIRVDDTGPARLETSTGTVALGHAAGPVTVVAAGDIRIEGVHGDAEVKNKLGDTRIGEIRGDLRVRSSSGDITIERAHGQTVARTANGAIRVDAVSGGGVNLATGSGRVDVGVPAGTAAWIDVASKFGRVVRDLDDVAAPGDDRAAVEIRARTSMGDISIHRA